VEGFGSTFSKGGRVWLHLFKSGFLVSVQKHTLKKKLKYFCGYK